jgi:hypothetical protein
MHLCPLQYDQSLSPERASQIRVGWHMVVRARVPVTSYGIPLKPTPAMRSPQPRTREWFFRRFSRAVAPDKGALKLAAAVGCSPDSFYRIGLMLDCRETHHGWVFQHKRAIVAPGSAKRD